MRIIKKLYIGVGGPIFCQQNQCFYGPQHLCGFIRESALMDWKLINGQGEYSADVAGIH